MHELFTGESHTLHTVPSITSVRIRCDPDLVSRLRTDPTELLLPSAWPPSPVMTLAHIKAALAWHPPPRTVPLLQFERTAAAAKHNLTVLRRFRYCLHSVIVNDPLSPLYPGSEFRPVTTLHPLFAGHPLWPNVRDILLQGAYSPLEPLLDGDRLVDLADAIAYGNHKGAVKHSARLLTALDDDVRAGFQVPLPISALSLLPGAIVAPLGMAHQQTIDGTGSHVDKYRMTHDQSMTFSSGTSVNSRMRLDDLPACIFGFALRRFLLKIVAYRLQYPAVPLLIAKTDFKSAYRRMHQDSQSAVRSIITTAGLEPAADQLALLCLRATFGNAANPTLFSQLSEITADLANLILHVGATTTLPPPRHSDKLSLPMFHQRHRSFRHRSACCH